MGLEKLRQILDAGKVETPDQEMYRRIKENWDHVAKPLDSLGKFEGIYAQTGAILGEECPKFERGKLYVFAADNGVVSEGISQSGQEVTTACAESIGGGRSCASMMAIAQGMEVELIDVGINHADPIPNTTNRKVRMGTRNFHVEPAMTQEEVLQAMAVGMDAVKEAKEAGYSILAGGEMGIGNTTTSAAVACALLGEKAEKLTGRGAGLNDASLQRKISVIQEALDRYQLSDASVLTILSHVGGFDLAALTGFYIGAAVYRIPVILDGLISLVAALCAQRLVEGVKDYLIPSHGSREPAAALLAKELGMEPVLMANMALGEGSGAVMLLPLLRIISVCYEKSAGFTGIGVQQYQRNGEQA